MAVKPLVSAPNPVLSRKTSRVKRVDAGVRRLVEDMIETMHDAHGVGLAANQIGVPLRIAVIQLPDEDEAVVLINPEVVLREGSRELTEGCLSIPGYSGLALRSEKVRVKAQGLDGKPFRIEAECDLMAQVLEHETDHLDGHLYVERLVSKDQLWKNDEDEVEEDEVEEDEEWDATEAASSSK